MAYRQKLDHGAYSNTAFNFIQFGLALLTVAAVASLIFAIPQGLLSNPNMMVTGNNSWSHHYNYFQDRAAEGAFPQVTMISVGLIVYRIAMLLWSLWLANRLLSWASWWWAGYSEGRAWVSRVRKDSSRDDQSENT
ncbi:hypothetical protein [Haliea salexigens]|uniref:hypothetical protein n=1 Tax=Haliea salexigens TaxID=287487 RepID=UPI0004105A49|nr:hypothetical protein [Haliea salexigens]